MQGIVSYGAYIPRFKIETGEIASVWGADGSACTDGDWTFQFVCL